MTSVFIDASDVGIRVMIEGDESYIREYSSRTEIFLGEEMKAIEERYICLLAEALTGKDGGVFG